MSAEAPAARGRLAIPVALVGIALIALALIDSSRLVGSSFPGFLVWDNGMLVSFHLRSWSGARAELPLNGGRIVAVEGKPFSGGRALIDTVAAYEPGRAVRYRVAWRGEERDYAVPAMRLTSGDYVATFGIYLLNAVSFLLIAVVALYLRPDLRAARALAVASLFMGGLLGLTIDYFASYRFVPVYQLLEACTPAALARFLLVFPVERLSARKRRMVTAGAWLLCLALGAGNLALFHGEPVVARRITWVIYLLIALTGIAMVSSFGQTLLRARSIEARVRAAVVFAGGLTAIFLPALAVLTFFLLGWVVSFSWITVLLPIFPLSMLYAVVRHDLLGVERFARLTVGYSLATSAVVASYAGFLLVMDALIARGAGTTPATSFLVLIAIAIGFDPLRRRVQRGVDRVFYRSSVDAADVLESSSADLAAISDEASIASYVEERLRTALEVLDSRLFLEPERPREAALCTPVLYRDELLGHLACGEKRSGAPFSGVERDLLKGLASQAALALRNARSVQALRDAQDRLVRSERLAAMGELAGAVAHGVRNPLSGIRATAQMALEQDPGGAHGEAMSVVLREADRLDHRVSTLLDFSRPFEPRPRAADLRDIVGSVRDAVSQRAEREGVKVLVVTPDEPVVAEIDPDTLEEALLELVGNALRALATGGRLELRVERGASGPVLRVADDGPGIPAAVHDRIFELFFTTRVDGTGMGLATVKKLVERQGGSVCLESSGPEGSVFRIELPE